MPLSDAKIGDLVDLLTTLVQESEIKEILAELRKRPERDEIKRTIELALEGPIVRPKAPTPKFTGFLATWRHYAFRFLAEYYWSDKEALAFAERRAKASPPALEELVQHFAYELGPVPGFCEILVRIATDPSAPPTMRSSAIGSIASARRDARSTARDLVTIAKGAEGAVLERAADALLQMHPDHPKTLPLAFKAARDLPQSFDESRQQRLTELMADDTVYRAFWVEAIRIAAVESDLALTLPLATASFRTACRELRGDGEFLAWLNKAAREAPLPPVRMATTIGLVHADWRNQATCDLLLERLQAPAEYKDRLELFNLLLSLYFDRPDVMARAVELLARESQGPKFRDLLGRFLVAGNLRDWVRVADSTIEAIGISEATTLYPHPMIGREDFLALISRVPAFSDGKRVSHFVYRWLEELKRKPHQLVETLTLNSEGAQAENRRTAPAKYGAWDASGSFARSKRSFGLPFRLTDVLRRCREARAKLLLRVVDFDRYRRSLGYLAFTTIKLAFLAFDGVVTWLLPKAPKRRRRKTATGLVWNAPTQVQIEGWNDQVGRLRQAVGLPEDGSAPPVSFGSDELEDLMNALRSPLGAGSEMEFVNSHLVQAFKRLDPDIVRPKLEEFLLQGRYRELTWINRDALNSVSARSAAWRILREHASTVPQLADLFDRIVREASQKSDFAVGSKGKVDEALEQICKPFPKDQAIVDRLVAWANIASFRRRAITNLVDAADAEGVLPVLFEYLDDESWDYWKNETLIALLSISAGRPDHLRRLESAISALPWHYKFETCKKFAEVNAESGALRRWLNPCLSRLIADIRQSAFLAARLLRLKGVQDGEDAAFFDICAAAARTDSKDLRQEALSWLAWRFFDRPETRKILTACLAEALEPDLRVAAFYGLMLRCSAHIEIAQVLKQCAHTEGVAKAGMPMQQLLKGKRAFSFSQLTAELGPEARREEDLLFKQAKAYLA